MFQRFFRIINGTYSGKVKAKLRYPSISVTPLNYADWHAQAQR